MASCRHCGKDSGSFAFCIPCGYYAELPPQRDTWPYTIMPTDPPPDGLARVKYNRALRAALKYLEEVAPTTAEQQQPLEEQQRNPDQ